MDSGYKPITYAYLETTNYCNLDCSFCNRKEVIGDLQHMPLYQWEKLLDGIKHHPIEEAKLMGMGEPLLHPHFDHICRMFKETFPNQNLLLLQIVSITSKRVWSLRKIPRMYEVY